MLHKLIDKNQARYIILSRIHNNHLKGFPSLPGHTETFVTVKFTTLDNISEVIVLNAAKPNHFNFQHFNYTCGFNESPRKQKIEMSKT